MYNTYQILKLMFGTFNRGNCVESELSCSTELLHRVNQVQLDFLFKLQQNTTLQCKLHRDLITFNFKTELNNFGCVKRTGWKCNSSTISYLSQRLSRTSLRLQVWTSLTRNWTQHRNCEKNRSLLQRRTQNTEIRSAFCTWPRKNRQQTPNLSSLVLIPETPASVRYTRRCLTLHSITLVAFQVIVPTCTAW